MISTEQDLLDFVRAWAHRHGRPFESLEPMAGDVSPRRYLRVLESSGRQWIVAFYPPELVEAGDRFRRASKLLSGVGVKVPAIEAWDRDAGIMLVEDVGRQAVYDVVQHGSAGPYWRRAIAILGKLSRLETRAVRELNPRIDHSLLRQELEQSLELVLDPQGLTGSDSTRTAFRDALDTLCRHLDEAQPRACHRDFMARNLLVDDQGELTVIDHQDLRLGPPWYDLASLLNDSLYATPEEEAELLELARVPKTERLTYHRVSAQRALKIVGTFAAFAQRGFDRHLVLVPSSLAAARRHLETLPETEALMAELGGAWHRPLDSLGFFSRPMKS